MKKEIIAGIDLGTTKVCAVIAERVGEGQSFTVLGFGIAPSEGLIMNLSSSLSQIFRSSISNSEYNFFIFGLTPAHVCSNMVHGWAGQQEGPARPRATTGRGIRAARWACLVG